MVWHKIDNLLNFFLHINNKDGNSSTILWKKLEFPNTYKYIKNIYIFIIYIIKYINNDT